MCYLPVFRRACLSSFAIIDLDVVIDVILNTIFVYDFCLTNKKTKKNIEFRWDGEGLY